MEDFDKRKRASLQALVNACEHDKSPKGSVDAPIQSLVDYINSLTDYATTSSCSGRISLFHTSGSDTTQKGVGIWLLALHGTLNGSAELSLALSAGLQANAQKPSMTIFKHEPFVLHVMCRTVEKAQLLLKVAMDAGFRESGLSIGGKKIMVGIRTTANVLECPIAHDGRILCNDDYIDFLSKEANKRFDENHRRTLHFEKLLRESIRNEPSIAASASAELPFGSEFSFDQSSFWRPLNDQLPLKRWGHTATDIGGGRILIFGGWGETFSVSDVKGATEKQQHAHLSEALLWEPAKSQQPSRRITSKLEPVGRAYHSVVPLNEDLTIMFGGRRSPQHPLADFWAFRNNLEEWQPVLHDDNANLPAPRWRHAASAMHESMFIYGGRCLDSVFEDLWRFSFVNEDSKVSLQSVEILSCSGASPGPRFAHAMLCCAQSKTLLLHGGFQDVRDAEGPKEIYVLDAGSMVWSQTIVTGLGWRFSHCWLSIGKTDSIIVGGLGKDYSRDDLQAMKALKLVLDPVEKLNDASVVLLNERMRVDSILAVQFAIVCIPAAFGYSLHLLGGGATCFAFGSIFGSSASLNGSVPQSTTIQQQSGTLSEKKVPVFVTDKVNAVQVKQALTEMGALDKSRKVHVNDSVIRFPLKVNVVLNEHKLTGLGAIEEMSGLGELVERKNPREQAAERKERILQRVFGGRKCKIEKVDDVLLIHSREITYGSQLEAISNEDWMDVISLYPGSQRVVWGAEIDEGPMRQSRNRLVYSPLKLMPAETSTCWVTVNENGITFSYDMLRCMYSKGNVSEKLRFGQLIQPEEVVVDLFAGIGYFTLPALKITSNAKLVHSCEWNPDAVYALRRNLKLNHVSPGKCIIHPGDCRRFRLAPGERAHRISLGLIPSSKVGWETAVACLSEEGGWLHVHGNAAETDVEQFGVTVAEEIQVLCRRIQRSDWVAQCTNVQKVKSYAPKVLHLVADIKCGPFSEELLAPTFVSSVKRVTMPSSKIVPRSKHNNRSRTYDVLSDDLRRVADQLLCVSSVSSLSVDEARLLSADGQLLMKRVSQNLKDVHF